MAIMFSHLGVRGGGGCGLLFWERTMEFCFCFLACPRRWDFGLSFPAWPPVSHPPTWPPGGRCSCWTRDSFLMGNWQPWHGIPALRGVHGVHWCRQIELVVEANAVAAAARSVLPSVSITGCWVGRAVGAACAWMWMWMCGWMDGGWWVDGWRMDGRERLGPPTEPSGWLGLHDLASRTPTKPRRAVSWGVPSSSWRSSWRSHGFSPWRSSWAIAGGGGSCCS